ncbi:MAG: hypothetical protein ACM3VZ_12200 [Acidobacteriota bacterium]
MPSPTLALFADTPESPLRLSLQSDGMPVSSPPALPVADKELTRWHDLVSQIGRELAEPLTAALERVTTLTTTGRIDRAGLRALRDEVDRARQTGIWCQQIARLASGRIRQSHERVHLTHTVQSVLAYRARELQGKGITLTQSLLPIEIQVDASMLFSLLNNLIDWWIDCAQGQVEVHVDRNPWPERARLVCKIVHRPVDQIDSHHDEDQMQSSLNTMNWHVLEQTAQTMGLSLDRQVGPTQARLSLQFPHTIGHTLQEPEPSAADAAFMDSVNSKPLAGSHVLVLASRRDLRVQVRESLKSMGLVLDFVTSVREASEFCREGLPHAIVFEGLARTAAFDKLVDSIRREVPEFVFIELLESGHTFDISSVSQTGMACVGRDAVATALPSALVYELTRIM